MTKKVNFTRDMRRSQLMSMWDSKEGRNAVIDRAHGILGPEKSIGPGMSFFEIILDHEFGDAEAQSIES
jgi:hypothetical protein